MVYAPITQPKQDMPPSGGYPKVRISRVDRKRGFSGFFLFGGLIAFTLYGNYCIYVTNFENKESKKKEDFTRKILHIYSEIESKIFLSLALSSYYIPGTTIPSYVQLNKVKRPADLNYIITKEPKLKPENSHH
mmetsp:Transcript_16703/g.15064  ORF Transcript_16703/g.15064 Transcript_16703/m.15064 type:complete len:133 (-) Transcript_16703:99-497(-)